MTHNVLKNIEQIESSLWEAADQLRANSKLTSSEYCTSLCEEVATIPSELDDFEATLADLSKQVTEFSNATKKLEIITTEQRQALTDAQEELAEAATAYEGDRSGLVKEMIAFRDRYQLSLPESNADQHSARQTFDPLAERVRGLVKQVDLLYKLAARAGQVAAAISPSPPAREGRGGGEATDRRFIAKKVKQLDEERKQAVEQLKLAAYFHRQIHWLQERFPDAVIQSVPGLCKVVNRVEIEAADWSLTPGRYVGVAPAEVDEDFDFEQTLKDIHVELADLNREAVELAARIQENFEELGV